MPDLIARHIAGLETGGEVAEVQHLLHEVLDAQPQVVWKIPLVACEVFHQGIFNQAVLATAILQRVVVADLAIGDATHPWRRTAQACPVHGKLRVEEFPCVLVLRPYGLLEESAERIPRHLVATQVAADPGGHLGLVGLERRLGEQTLGLLTDHAAQQAVKEA
ncbi:MAG TPA: hypothetical protein DD714_04750 [Candidatus Omnitrophica bacterium]|nr:hypothetical protein [Candidatus Omnitrophota bacterium]